MRRSPPGPFRRRSPGSNSQRSRPSSPSRTNIAAFNAREAAKVKAGEQAAAPRPPVTVEGIVQARLDERLRGDILWASQQEDRELSEQFRALTAAEKAAVRALLKKGKK